MIMAKKKDDKEIKIPRMMESLGWLTETTLQPRKGKPIEGIPSGTIVELKAQYYKTQEKTKNEKELGNFGGRKKRNKGGDNFGGSSNLGISTNKGVYERAKRDRLELKGTNDKLDKCSLVLEEKSKLYDKLMDGDGNSEDDEKYEVDFFEKRFEKLRKTTTGNNKIKDLMNTNEEELDEEELELREKAERALKRKMVMEEVEKTKEGQEKAKLAKKKKEEKEKKEKEILKELFLKKQLEKLKMKRKTTNKS